MSGNAGKDQSPPGCPGREGVERAFDGLAGALDYPMYIVTVACGGEEAGCLVGFATQCSIEPARFLVCISKANRTFTLATRCDSMLVHVVPAAAHELVELFGGETGDEVDKFARCRWHPGPHRLPVLEDCSSWFAGSICGRLPCGDHEAFLLEPFAVHHDGEQELFAFRRAREIDPGHPA